MRPLPSTILRFPSHSHQLLYLCLTNRSWRVSRSLACRLTCSGFAGPLLDILSYSSPAHFNHQRASTSLLFTNLLRPLFAANRSIFPSLLWDYSCIIISLSPQESQREWLSFHTTPWFYFLAYKRVHYFNSLLNTKRMLACFPFLLTFFPSTFYPITCTWPLLLSLPFTSISATANIIHSLSINWF